MIWYKERREEVEDGESLYFSHDIAIVKSRGHHNEMYIGKRNRNGNGNERCLPTNTHQAWGRGALETPRGKGQFGQSYPSESKSYS